MSPHAPTASSAATVPLANESHHVLVEALGSVIGVEGLSAAEASEFRQAWSRCLALPESIAAASVRRIPGDFARANESLTSAITLAAIELLAGQRMMFHACGLADPLSGATVAFIAPSGTGKTTVARTLGPGLGYVSDETIAVGSDLGIVSYPKPLSVKQPEPGRPKLQQGPDHHVLGVTPPAPVLAAITILSRTPHDAGAPADAVSVSASVEDVPLAQAIVELTPQLSALARLDRGLVQLCTMVQACGGVKRIRYSEAASIAPLLPQLVRPVEAGTPAQWMALETTPESANARAGMRRTPVQDAIDADGTVLLLIDSQVLELGPLGALVWEFASDWTTREAILGKVIEVIGGHPSADALIDEALAELLSRGVLENA